MRRLLLVLSLLFVSIPLTAQIVFNTPSDRAHFYVWSSANKTMVVVRSNGDVIIDWDAIDVAIESNDPGMDQIKAMLKALVAVRDKTWKPMPK